MALLVLAMVGSLLALAVPPPSISGAQEPENTEATHTVWTSECIGEAAGIGQTQFEPLGFTIEHPETVEPDTEFTFRVIPDEGYLPDKAFNDLVGEVTVTGLEDIKLMFNLPTNAELVSVSIVPDSTYGTAGPYGIAVDESFSPARLVLSVGAVVKNPSLPDNSTPFKHPSFDVTVRATGAEGSTISTRVSGLDRASTGYTFLANNNYAQATVYCWAQGNVPAPVLFGTVISSGTTTIPTTTALTANPTLLPGGSKSMLTATVTTADGPASSGAVRFADGGVSLGLAELNADGVASFEATLNNVGTRSITATYLGSPLFEGSTSNAVVVTVTNPANRTPVQLSVVPSNSNPPTNGGQAIASPIDVTVTVEPTGDATQDPTGMVRLYDGDSLVGEASLAEGFAVFTTGPLAEGGHIMRAEYDGDTEYLPGFGTAGVSASLTTNSSVVNGSNFPLTGTITLNNATAAVPASTFLNGSYRTDHTGFQTLAGTFLVPSTTYTIPGGTITGSLVQANGTTVGGLDNVWDDGTSSWLPGAEAELAGDLFFQVTEANFGGGTVSFGSSCALGPFEVAFEGTRSGTSGDLPLPSQPGSYIPAAQGCITESGISLAAPVNSALSGGVVDFDWTLTGTPAAGMPVEIADVTVSQPYSFYGEPITVTATASTDFGLFSFNTNQIDFYSNGTLVQQGFPFTFNTPTVTGSDVIPREEGAGGSWPPLPVGENELTAVFVPIQGARLQFASSAPSSPTAHTVYPAVEKHEVNVELEVQEIAATAASVPVTIRVTPAPNSVAAPAPLQGSVTLIDDLEPNPALQQVRTSSSTTLSPSSDGIIQTQIALSPGPHSLRAVFTPSYPGSNWWWGAAESNSAPIDVSGEMRKFTLERTFSGLRGGDLFPGITTQNSATWGFEVGPVECVEPYGSVSVYVEIDGVPTGTQSFGRYEYFDQSIPTSLGEHTVKLWADPMAPTTGDNPQAPYNSGCLPSDPIEVTYTVVPVSTEDPFQTHSQIQSIFPVGQAGTNSTADGDPRPIPPFPAVEGVAWSQINGYASYVMNANPRMTGVMSYFAENTETDVVTPLGTGTVTFIARSGDGRGLGRLSNSPATATLPAGTYEVWGEFAPDNPEFLSSVSPRFTQVVVPAGSPAASNISLATLPEGSSIPGEPVLLTATVGPNNLNAGTVEFFDGETSLGIATVNEGVATRTAWSLGLGEHSLTATFTSANPSAVNGSTSAAVAHQVVEPAVETTTTLEVSPAEHATEGTDVTLTATVMPSEAVGSVTFGDEHGTIGTAELVEGVATLVVNDLELGSHELFAEFVPTDELAFSPSESEGVPYIIDAAPVGPVETGTTLAIDPEGSAHLGEDVTLTATITPSEAVGTVTFIDGETTIAGPVAVTGGQAEVVVNSLAPGSHSLSAVFTPEDPEAFEGSASPAQDYEIDEDFAEPVFECQGADAFSVGIMTSLVAPPDGILFLGTELEATVPETLANGGTGDVSFAWSVTLPEALANLAIEAQAEVIYMEDMDLAMQASGGSEQLWEFPEGYTITDPTATITLGASGTVTASAAQDIAYAMRSPLNITIHVPPTEIVFQDVYVKLSCVVHNATQAVTTVQGGATAPGAPTDVSAEAGPLMAHVSWTPPADDGGSPITGYVVTASPGGKTTHTSAEVTHVDVIGLEEGQDYTFTVQAVNEVGQGEASEPSNEVTPGPGEDFSDVQPDHPFYAEIEWLAATGITTGMGDGSFGANLNLTRQAMAAFLYRLEGSPDGADPECSSMPFTDVSLDNAFCGEIQWLKDEGITQGNGDGTFNPTGNLSRQAMSAFLYRLANGPDTPPACTTSPYPDVPTSNVFCPQITWMGEVGITTTPPDENFRPTDSLTRQAMAAFLYRYTTVIPTEL